MINLIQFHAAGENPCWKLGRKTPSSHAIIHETTTPKTRGKTRFWKNCYLDQPSIILQDLAITAKTSTSEVMSKDPTWQDG
jgi:hypothetical protein